MAILRLPGGAALSGFRLEKLNAALAASPPPSRLPSRKPDPRAAASAPARARDARAPLALRGGRAHGHGRAARHAREPAALRPGPAARRATHGPDGARGAAARDRVALVLEGDRDRPAVQPRLRAPD